MYSGYTGEPQAVHVRAFGMGDKIGPMDGHRSDLEREKYEERDTYGPDVVRLPGCMW